MIALLHHLQALSGLNVGPDLPVAIPEGVEWRAVITHFEQSAGGKRVKQVDSERTVRLVDSQGLGGNSGS